MTDDARRAKARDRVSMREVAALAQVSIGTVSNVLNNPDRVLPATRERVEGAIAELGWIPNKQAQHLRAGRSRTVGVALMDVANPFFADILRGASARLEAAGYSVLIGDADQDPARQARILHGFLEQRVRGVILGPIGATPPEVGELAGAGIPTVLFDRFTQDAECCSVGVDDVTGGRIAIEHLTQVGHRSVAFVGGPSTLAQVRKRREGAEAAAAAAGATLLAISTPQLDVAGGRQAAEEIALMPADLRPTGVYCANDMTAIGLLQGLMRQGLRVPEDIAIVGYDDIVFAAAAAVPLSSVAQPRRELGAAAADLLLAEIADDEASRTHVHRSLQFTPTLSVRHSSSPRPVPPP
ncbi:LacI family DNA-binding transcriptional regulator [Tessaracoccus sp.]|uniref:LacI family DNA-binding transcriptional regulator n=1 Tax=Tessaracoccus sp. TaxID=1971211 RepID=UPI00261F631B|nr:LacI family DNA-binding transcriptional regulator [Tessaracoccus sp.]